MNIVSLLGRLTAEVELKHTENQVPVCSFTLAVDRAYTPKGQEKQTDFINIVAWRQTAELVSRYFRKGQRMALTGTLQSRRYTDKEGNNRTAYEVVHREEILRAAMAYAARQTARHTAHRAAANARPRWESAFFSSAESSANVCSYPSGTNSGS